MIGPYKKARVSQIAYALLHINTMCYTINQIDVEAIMDTKQLNARLSDEMWKRLQKAADKKTNPYAPSMTQIVQRGIDLALQELEESSTLTKKD